MFNQPKQRNHHPNTQITLSGHEIQNVTNFKYLGSMMRSSESDFQTRRGQAWNAFGKMKSIWRSKVVPIKLKINIPRPLVNPSCCMAVRVGLSQNNLATRSIVSPQQPTGKCLTSNVQTKCPMNAFTNSLDKSRSSGKSNNVSYALLATVCEESQRNSLINTPYTPRKRHTESANVDAQR
jgi:hypothetical protein